MDIVADMDFAEMDAEKQYRLMYAECLGDRPGAKALLLWMESAGFFTAPASARHHLNTPGGLCRHTINVAMNASDLCNTPAFMDVNAKEAMVAALLHDLCKIGKYRAGDNGKYTYDDTRLLGHGEESVIIAQQFIRLSYDETLAIRWHMGAYSGERDWNTLGKVFPTPAALVNLQALQGLGLGYRDKYIARLAQNVCYGKIDLAALQQMPTEAAHTYLKSIFGIGEKVSNCILLFGLGRKEAFPVDTWTKKIIAREYAGKFPVELYPQTAGVIQQYMFYAERSRK